MRLHFVERLLPAAVLLLVACGGATNPGMRDVRISSGGSASTRITQVELQEEVQRVATSFMERVAQVIEPSSLDDSVPPALEQALMRRVLVYTASALDIATGPFPEVNALDLAVFAALSKGVLERHWIKRGFGDQGRALVRAFDALERELGTALPRVIDAEKQADLRQLIGEWQRNNADLVLVEGVRFQQFSAFAADAARATKARGLMRQVKSAIQLGDQALLMSERAFFVAHRLPFLLRLQARLGVQETLTDSVARLDDVDGLLDKTSELRPMLSDLRELTDRAAVAAQEARLLMAAADPALERVTAPENRELVLGMSGTLESAKQLTERSIELVREMRASVPANPDQTLTRLEQRADGVLRRWVVYLLVLGFAWSLFFWSGYVLVKRLTT